MVRSRWLALRTLKRQSRTNVEGSNSADPSSSEAKADDGNSKSISSSGAGSKQETNFVKDSHSWTSLSPRGTRPEPRYSHAATVVGKKMVVVGGESSDGLLDDVQVSWGRMVLLIGGQTIPPFDHVSVWEFDTETESWSSIEAKGDIPIARSGQSVTKAGSILFMFGGEDAKGRKLKDLHMFDLKSLTWLSLQTTGSGPSPRSKHVAALYDDRLLLIFGGASKSKAMNDLFSLDFETFGNFGFINVVNKMLDPSDWYNDLIDVLSYLQSQIHNCKNCNSLFATRRNCLMGWSKIKTRGFSPSRRAGCGAVLSGDKWYITGGKGRKTRCLETLVLEISTMTWSIMVTSANNSVLSNEGFSLVLMERKEGTFLVAFGGYNGEYSNEVEVLVTTLSEENEQSCKSTQKELVHREDSSVSTNENTPCTLAPVVASGKVPCSCITVAKHNLTSAIDHHSSSQRSFSEASAGSHTSDIAGILPLRNLFQHEEEFSAEPIAQRNSNGRKEKEHSGQSLKESKSRQGSKHFEGMGSTRQTNVVPSFPEADSQVLPKFDNCELIQTNQNGSTEIEEQLARHGTCQNVGPGSRIQYPSSRCAQLPLEMLSRNMTQLAHDSQSGYLESEIDGEANNVICAEKRMRSLLDIHEQYELKLAAALKKNLITENQLSAAITCKEAAENSLSAVLKAQKNSETALSEALKEIEVLKEKVVAAELVQEEANNLSNVVHAENVRLEHDMAFLKAVLDDTQKELHTTRGILTSEKTRAFQLQVEVFQLRQKLQSAENRASTPKKPYQL